MAPAILDLEPNEAMRAPTKFNRKNTKERDVKEGIKLIVVTEIVPENKQSNLDRHS